MSRFHWRVGAATALLALLAACGVPGGTSAASSDTARVPELAPDQRVSITFESYNLISPGKQADTVRQLVGEFEQQYPQIDVDARPPQGTIDELTGAIQRQIVAGNPPDVAQLVFGDLDFAVNNLRVKALDDLVGRDAVQAHFQAGTPYAPRAAVLGDQQGRTYGFPYVFSTPVLYYNADLFRAAGLDPATPPRNWAEVKQAGLAIAATGASGLHLSCLGANNYDWCLQGIIRSNGGTVLNPERTAVTFDAPKTIKALAMWQDLVAAGVAPDLSSADAQDRFQRGELGMFLQSSAVQASLMAAAEGRFELAAAPMPGFGDSPAVPTNSGSALFVLADDPAEGRASWELIKFMTGERAQTVIAQNVGYVPLRPGLVDDPAALQGWAEQNPLVRVNIAQLGRLEPWQSYPGPNYSQIRNFLTNGAADVVYQGADPVATMRAAQQQAESFMPGGR